MGLLGYEIKELLNDWGNLVQKVAGEQVQKISLMDSLAHAESPCIGPRTEPWSPRPKDGAAILSTPVSCPVSPQWIIAELACYTYSMVVVPLYDTLGPGVIRYIINTGKPLCHYWPQSLTACSPSLTLDVLCFCSQKAVGAHSWAARLASCIPAFPSWVSPGGCSSGLVCRGASNTNSTQAAALGGSQLLGTVASGCDCLKPVWEEAGLS